MSETVLSKEHVQPAPEAPHQQRRRDRQPRDKAQPQPRRPDPGDEGQPIGDRHPDQPIADGGNDHRHARVLHAPQHPQPDDLHGVGQLEQRGIEHQPGGDGDHLVEAHLVTLGMHAVTQGHVMDGDFSAA